MKKAIATSLTALVLASSTTAEAQDQEQPFGYIEKQDPSARVGVLGFNVLANGLLTGIIGAAEGRNFGEDFAKGMVGGTFQYLGMELAMYDVPILPGIASKLTEIGASTVENTIAGRGMVDRLHFGFGPAVIEINNTEETQKEFGPVNIYWRFLPAGGIFYNMAEGNNFDLAETFSHMVPVFTTDYKLNHNGKSAILGATVGNVISYDKNFRQTLKHEFVHVMQYERMKIGQEVLRLTLPSVTNWLEKYPHLRIGEDLTYSLFSTPQMICRFTDEEICAKRWWNLHEDEANIMKTVSDLKEPNIPSK